MTAARAGTDDHDLSLLDPIVQGARKTIVERHRWRRGRRKSQARGGGSEQNPAHQAAAIDLIHRLLPPLTNCDYTP